MSSGVCDCVVGLVIACYLIFNDRISSQEAITYVRRCRTGAIQTHDQVKFIQEFEEFLIRIRIIYALPSDPMATVTGPLSDSFTIEQFSKFQLRVSRVIK